MSTFNARYPLDTSNIVPTYANLAAFPSAVGAGNGALAIALNTDILYISTGVVWEALADPSYSPGAITALTGDVSATGPGSAAATVNAVGGSTAANVNAATVLANAATSVNTASTIVRRDASGNFAAGTITANLTGTASGNPPNSRAINTTAPITGGGDLSTDRTIAIPAATGSVNGYLTSTDWTTFNNKQSALSLGNLTDVGTDGITVTGGTGAVIGSGTSLSQHVADSTHNGYLSSTDWSTFNSKQAALTIGNLTAAGTDGIAVTGGTSAIIGSGTSIAQQVSDATHNGYLSSANWSTFNGKQASGNYITALTGDVTASGPGSVASTVAKIAGTTVSGTTGSTNVVFSNSPTLVTPVLGTPSSGNLSNCTAYPNVTQSVAGLVVSAGQLLGTNAPGTAATAGNVGEIVSAFQSSAVNAANSNTWKQLVSISLTAGDWDIRASVTLLDNGATLTVSSTNQAAISTTTAADAVSPANNSYDTIAWSSAIITLVQDCRAFMPITKQPTSTTVYYLNVLSNYSAGTPQWRGAMEARRVR